MKRLCINPYCLVSIFIISAIGSFNISCTKLNTYLSDNKLALIVKAINIDSKDTTSGNNLIEGTEVGLLVHEVKSSSESDNPQLTTLMHNCKFVIKDQIMSGIPVILSKDAMYWLTGYYPFVSNESIKNNFIEYQFNTDIIWGRAVYPLNICNDKLNELKLSFMHLTSQVQFSINDLRDSLSKELYPAENMKFEINYLSQNMILDIINGIVIPGISMSNLSINWLNTPHYISPSGKSVSTKFEIVVSFYPNGGNSDNCQIFRKIINYNFIKNTSYNFKTTIKTDDIDVNAQIVEWQSIIADDLFITK